MKPFLKNLTAFLRGSCPAIHRRYDVAGDVYKNREDQEPAFSYAFKGEYTLDVRHLLAAAIGVATWCISHFAKKKRKKKWQKAANAAFFFS